MEIEGFISLGAALTQVLEGLGKTQSVRIVTPQLGASLAVKPAERLGLRNAKDCGYLGSVKALPEQ